MKTHRDRLHSHTRSSRSSAFIMSDGSSSDGRSSKPKHSPLRPGGPKPSAVSEDTVSSRDMTRELSPLAMKLKHKYLGNNKTMCLRGKAFPDNGVRPMDLDGESSAAALAGKLGVAGDRKVVKPHPHKRRANPHKRVLRSRKRRAVQPKYTQTPEHTREGDQTSTQPPANAHEVPTRGQKRRRMTVAEGSDSDNTSEVCRRISRLTVAQLLTYESGLGPHHQHDLRELKPLANEMSTSLEPKPDIREHQHNTRRNKHHVAEGKHAAPDSKPSARESRHHTRENRSKAMDYTRDDVQGARMCTTHTRRSCRSSRKCRIIAQAPDTEVSNIILRERKQRSAPIGETYEQDCMRDSISPHPMQDVLRNEGKTAHADGNETLSVECTYEGCQRIFGDQTARAEHIRIEHTEEGILEEDADKSLSQTDNIVFESGSFQKFENAACGAGISVL